MMVRDEDIKIGDIVRFSTASKYNPGFRTSETYVGVVVRKPFREDCLHVEVDGRVASIKSWHVERVLGNIGDGGDVCGR